MKNNKKIIIVVIVCVLLVLVYRAGMSKGRKVTNTVENTAAQTTQTEPVEAPAETSQPEVADTPVETTQTEPADTPAETTQPEDVPTDSDGVSPELKAFCEKYLEFMRDYVELSKKAASGGADSLTAMIEFAQKAIELSEYEDEFAKIDRDELSTADAAYMLEFEKELLELTAQVLN